LHKIIVITGSKGLIGGALARRLLGYKTLLVDDYPDGINLHRRDLFRWMLDNHRDVEVVFHMGANTNTLETDKGIFDEHNLGYTQSLWYKCARHNIPFIYASSAATYGNGDMGYSDSLLPQQLTPLNAYAESKNEFDKFAFSNNHIPHFHWYGLKFFNVYGYDESHKGKMASMIYQSYNQIKETKKVKLFEGQYFRDFIFVEDVVDVLIWMWRNLPKSGVYNVGTGIAESFDFLTSCVFESMGIDEKIEYIPMPEKIKSKYQTNTKASIEKLIEAGYDKPFISLKDGIRTYIKQLENGRTKV